MSEQEGLDEERVARELTEELAKLRVESVLIGALIQVSSIGYRRLGLTEDTAGERDLEQTKLAIDTMKALTPVLEEVVAPELVRDFNSSVANLQLAYAKAASDLPGGLSGGQTPGHGQEGQEASADAGSRAAANTDDEAETDMTRGQTPESESDERAEGGG